MPDHLCLLKAGVPPACIMEQGTEMYVLAGTDICLFLAPQCIRARKSALEQLSTATAYFAPAYAAMVFSKRSTREYSFINIHVCDVGAAV